MSFSFTPKYLNYYLSRKSVNDTVSWLYILRFEAQSKKYSHRMNFRNYYFERFLNYWPSYHIFMKLGNEKTSLSLSYHIIWHLQRRYLPFKDILQFRTVVHLRCWNGSFVAMSNTTPLGSVYGQVLPLDYRNDST